MAHARKELTLHLCCCCRLQYISAATEKQVQHHPSRDNLLANVSNSPFLFMQPIQHIYMPCRKSYDRCLEWPQGLIKLGVFGMIEKPCVCNSYRLVSQTVMRACISPEPCKSLSPLPPPPIVCLQHAFPLCFLCFSLKGKSYNMDLINSAMCMSTRSSVCSCEFIWVCC